MPWHAQQRVKRNVRNLLVTIDLVEHPRQSDRTRAERAAWGREVRAEARRLERLHRVEYATSPDPCAAQHRADLIAAVYGQEGP